MIRVESKILIIDEILLIMNICQLFSQYKTRNNANKIISSVQTINAIYSLNLILILNNIKISKINHQIITILF